VLCAVVRSMGTVTSWPRAGGNCPRPP